MKNRLTAAALAAFFLLPIFGLTAYATELNGISETPIVVEDASETETPEVLGIDSDETPPATPTENPDMAELPALPPGTATVIDYNTDPDGRLFYTIMTPDEHVFYLIIDKSSNADNVYFLNAVTVADLLPLAETPQQTPGGTATTPPTTTGDTEQSTETPPSPEVEQPQNGGNKGMYILIGVLVILGGGAGWYFKVYRPKQQGAADGDEYDPSMDDAENDYSDEWGEDSDDDDDNPPGNENGESESGE